MDSNIYIINLIKIIGIHLHLQDFLDYKDYSNLLIVSGEYYFLLDKYDSYLKDKKFKLVNKFLVYFKYQKFVLGLKNLDTFYLDKILLKVFNLINIPTIWKNYSECYYDIRYIFELIYRGARIDLEKINDKFNKSIYHLYYDNIIKNLSSSRDLTIHNLLSKYDLFFILDSKFKPFYKKNIIGK